MNNRTDQSISLSLRRNFSWTLAGNVVYGGCQWAMLVVLARLATPELVGRFALAFAVTAPVVMFTNLQLSAVEATDAKRDYLFADYLALRMLTCALAMAAIAVIALLSGHSAAGVILAVGLAKVFESMSDIYHGLLQQHERMDRIGISMVIKGPLSLAALAATYFLTGSLFWGTMSMAAVWGVVLALYDIRSGALVLAKSNEFREKFREKGFPKQPAQSAQSAMDFGKRVSRNIGGGVWDTSLRPRWNAKILRKLAGLSLPLGIAMMLVSLNANTPRYFVEWKLGEADLGFFAAMTQLMMFGNTVMGALGQSASPRMARLYAERNRSGFASLLMKLSGIGALIGAAGVLIAAIAGRWVLGSLYGPAYASHPNVFVWISVASGISYVGWFLGCGMTASRRFRVQVPLLAVTSAVTTLACLLLIPEMGMVGAALATVVAALVLTLGSLAVNMQAIRRINEQIGGA
jgi:O-antigen/teichoic acid export membrane protein